MRIGRPACAILVLLPLAASLCSGQFAYSTLPFRPGEVLTYKVKWSVFRLGTLTIGQELPDSAFPQYFQVTLDGSSAAGLPFINVYFRSTSLLHSSDPTNILYELLADPGAHERMAYMYDPANARTLCVSLKGGEVDRLDTLEAPVPYYDGTGLLMFTRAASGSDTTIALPTIMDYAMGTTTIRFTRLVDMLEVPAYAHEVPGQLFIGSTSWKGSSFAGMTGDFRGWVSTDSLRVVLRAEVKIFLGSAVLELESIGSRPDEGEEKNP